MSESIFASGGMHQQLPVTAVGGVAKEKVTPKVFAETAKATWLPVAQPGNDKD